MAASSAWSWSSASSTLRAQLVGGAGRIEFRGSVADYVAAGDEVPTPVRHDAQAVGKQSIGGVRAGQIGPGAGKLVAQVDDDLAHMPRRHLTQRGTKKRVESRRSGQVSH
jgi:hypothetical protein